MEYLLVYVLGVICGIVLMLNVVSRRLGCVQSTLSEIRCMLLEGGLRPAENAAVKTATQQLDESGKELQKALDEAPKGEN